LTVNLNATTPYDVTCLPDDHKNALFVIYDSQNLRSRCTLCCDIKAAKS